MSESLTSLSTFQHRIHSVGDAEKNPNDLILSSVFPSYLKVEYSTPITVPMKLTTEKSGRTELHIYECDLQADHGTLSGMYLEFDTPQIEVVPAYQDKIRISWTDYLFHAMCKEASMIGTKNGTKQDKVTIQYRNTHILNNIAQYELAKDREKYERSIGNLPTLISPDLVKLPATPLAPAQLWSFSTYMSSYPFPLVYHRRNRVYFQYEFILEISKLLRMSEFINGVWEPIDLNLMYLKIDGITIDVKDTKSDIVMIKAPRATACYRALTDICKEHYLNNVFYQLNSSGTTDMRVYYDDYTEIGIERPTWNPDKGESGKDKIVPLQTRDTTDKKLVSQESPCKTLYWCLENRKSVRKNLHCNYTTNSNDISIGMSPIAHHEINYRNTKVLNVSRAIMGSLDTGCRTRPNVEGYHSYSSALSTNPDRLEPGWTFETSDSLKLSSTKKDAAQIGEEVGSRSAIDSSVKNKDLENAPYVLHVIKKVLRCISYHAVESKNDDEGMIISFRIE